MLVAMPEKHFCGRQLLDACRSEAALDPGVAPLAADLPGCFVAQIVYRHPPSASEVRTRRQGAGPIRGARRPALRPTSQQVVPRDSAELICCGETSLPSAPLNSSTRWAVSQV